MIEIICIICSKKRLESPYRIKMGYGKFCSRNCHIKHRRRNQLSKQELIYLYHEKNMSLKEIGKKQGIDTKAIFNLMKRLNIKTRTELGKSFKGGRPWNYVNGISKIGRRYHSNEYKKWRREIFERDNYTCQICGERGKKLNADHITPVFKEREKIFDIENGQTLCILCHNEKTKNELKENWINQYARAK